MASPPEYYISSDYSPYDDSSAYDPQGSANLTNKIMVAAIVVICCIIFFVSSLHIYGKWLWRSPTRNVTRLQLHHLDHLEHEATRNAGLSKAAIALLPTFTYTAPTMADAEATQNASSMLECAVCLSEFQENEKGRTLPACKHSFHVECIDMWFYYHSTCPLCRSVVMCSITCKTAAISSSLPTHEDDQQILREQEEEAAHEVCITVDTATPLASTSLSPFSPLAARHNLTNATKGSSPSQVDPTHKNIEMSSSSSLSSIKLKKRCLPHITIQVPPRQDVLRITSPGVCIPMQSRSWALRCHVSPAYCQSGSSHTTSVKSPGMQASLKRMSSMQSGQGMSQLVVGKSPKTQ